MTRSLVVLLIAALGLNLAASLAQASCAPQTLAEQAERADVVAFGNVSGSSFHVREALKGQVPATIQVRFGEGGPGIVTSVDYTATNGDHTLYLRRDGSEYATNACSGSHEGADPRHDLVADPVTLQHRHLLQHCSENAGVACVDSGDQLTLGSSRNHKVADLFKGKAGAAVDLCALLS